MTREPPLKDTSDRMGEGRRIADVLADIESDLNRLELKLGETEMPFKDAEEFQGLTKSIRAMLKEVGA